MVDWQQLAVTKAEELGAEDAEASAALILRAISPQRIIDEACMNRQHGVPPPPGDDLRCVDFERHSDQYDSDNEALEAWRSNRIEEEHRLSNDYPCQLVLEEAIAQFEATIEASWGIFEPGQMLDHLAYIQDNISKVPPKFQEKWKHEFIALFGREKPFAEFTPEEASWLRQRVAGYVSTANKVGRKSRRKSQRSKRQSQRQPVSKRGKGSR